MRKIGKAALIALPLLALCSCGHAVEAEAAERPGWDEEASYISLRLGEYSAWYGKKSEWQDKLLVRWRDDNGVVTVVTPVATTVYRGWAYVVGYEK